MRWKYWKGMRLVLASCIVIGLAGCGNSEHEAVLDLAKCMKAANYLEDSALSAAAQHRAESVWKEKPGSAKYAMEVAQELRDEAEPHGSSTHPLHILKVAREWKATDYCEQVEADFVQYIDEEVSKHSTPVADTTTDPASCANYVKQFDLYSSRYAKRHREDMATAVNASLSGALGQLKDFQLDVARAKLESADFNKFAYEVYDQCKPGGVLSEKLAQIRTIQELRSPVTKEISAFIDAANASRGDCGEFERDYCKADLVRHAAHAALTKSEQCDRDIKNLQCATTAEALINLELQPLEQAKLLAMQEKYKKFIADPQKYDGNTYSNIERLANKCKHGAIDKGLRDAAYSSYVKATCLPAAREEYLKPTMEYLARIESSLIN